MASLTILFDTLLMRLAWTSAQAVLLIGAIWLIGRLLPQLPSALRCMLWWLVGLQLVLGLCWSSPLQLRVLAPAAQIATVVPDHAILPAAAITDAASTIHFVSGSTQPTSTAWYSHWRPILVSLWLAVVLMQLLVAGSQWRSARRVLRESRPLGNDLLRAVCAEQVRKLGLRRQPELRVSAAIDSPQITGLWHTTVLLPAEQRLTPSESAMAMAHELAHLRRGDLWLGWVPAIAQRLFFFHPLVAWAMREYALTREAACDAQVLQQTGTMPQAYGHLLLRLGVSHPMHSGLAGASPSFHNLKRRLTMLQQSDNLSRQRLRVWPLIMLIVLAGVLPYRVTASASPAGSPQTAARTHATPGDPTPPSPPPPPPPSPLPSPPPLPPLPPTPPPAPLPPPNPGNRFSARHVDIDTHSNAREGFALIDGDAVTINGSENDLRTVEQLSKSNRPMLWFRRGDKAYLVRDASYIQRAKAIYAPVSALGKQQGTLGGEQGRLGGLQGGLGARQGALGSQQGELASRQAKLASEQAELSGRADGDKRQAEFETRQAALQTREDELGRQQDDLGRQQEALGKQQEALGTKQEALGKRQEEATAQANQQIGKLLDEALAKGVAQAINPR
jgi:bla regulator protein blaR1